MADIIKKFEPAEIDGVHHDEDADLTHIGGYTEVTMKEVHSEQNDEDWEERTLCFIMEDSVGNKRLCRVSLDKFDDGLRDAGYCIKSV